MIYDNLKKNKNNIVEVKNKVIIYEKLSLILTIGKPIFLLL